MIDLQHQCGSAAEAPLRREAVRLPEMVKNIYGEIEKDRPFARPLCRHGVRPPAVACSPKVRRFYRRLGRSEEHTSELKSLMRISYAVFCLTEKQTITSDLKNIVPC